MSEDLSISDLPTGEELDVQILRPEPADTGTRLDRYLAANFPDASRNYLQRLIADGCVLVDGIERKQTFKVTAGQEILVTVPEIEQPALTAEDIPLDIIFEDRDIIVLNKPSGLVVHPGPGNPGGTLVNGLLFYKPGLEVGGKHRPGIVHRLDRDTSGVMVVAISDRGHRSLTEQWAHRTVDKRYLTLVRGEVEEEEGTIDVPVGRHTGDRLRMAAVASGKPAVSHFSVIQRVAGATLLEIELVTGRTHQIRVHMAFIGHPVIGDAVYNRNSGKFGGSGSFVARQFLHASRLAFALPATGERRTFEAPLPDDLRSALETLQADSASARRP
ncbi:MAG: RluA family pseudouridine synthase [Thermomicrobiales bacterium]